ncbi:CBS domain-containing protein [Clostridium cylindrosporum]|uniref:CBS domain-containing protein n=1 Tax=Clostridium cylindrosporum DSM 605 TaxID=1121307 RepID=A0A0J8D578_CLOCY|nr:CBS domain-containing protein [Clostridium cylindrosporum]KMT20972.1 hypothetical protein CLCY_1c02060 [Clostridium cylindrosporum DSM 605]
MLDNVIITEFIKLMPLNTVREALNSLTENKVNGAPIVDSEGKLVGIIVKADLYRFLMEKGHFDTCPLEWVMTKSVITAKEDESEISIAKKLRENNIVSIPVVDANDIVKGMVTLESILDSIIDSYQNN